MDSTKESSDADFDGQDTVPEGSDNDEYQKAWEEKRLRLEQVQCFTPPPLFGTGLGVCLLKTTVGVQTREEESERE